MTRKERIKRQLSYHKKVEQAWAKAKEIGEEVGFLRHMILTDVYFLLYYIMERKDICYEEWWENDQLTIDGVDVTKGEGDELVKDDFGNVIEDPKKGRRWRYYRPFLFERCQEVQREPDGYLDIWSRDHYKDLADDTPVWTLDGWKTQGTVEVGDYVMTPNGPSKVVAVRHFTDSHCKKINFKGGVSVVCGNGHLWKVNDFNDARIKGTEKRIGWEEKVQETGDIHVVKTKHPYISIPKPYKGDKVALPVDPYVLGVWLGDGAKDCGRVTNEDKEVWEKIEELGWKLSEDSYKGKYSAQTRTVYGLMQELKHLLVFNNKHIPEIYLCASYEDRLELFRGLMDTDGTITSRKDGNTCTFTQKDYGMVRDFMALAASLGFRCRVCKQKTNFDTDAYYVSFSARPDLPNPFHIKRKADRVNLGYKPQKQSANWYIQSIEEHETVPTTCIQIEDTEGMYFCTDYWIQTHNSTIITFALTVQEILKNPEITICIYSYNVSTAQKMLVQIKNVLQGNQILLACFPEILFTNTNASSWKDESGTVHKMEWSNDGFNVKRKSNPKEHTLECSGLVTGQKTGGHYNLLIYDDTVTPESVATRSQIEKTTSQFEMSLNTGSTANMRIRMIGTRYALGDTYEKVLKAGTVKLRKYPCVDDEGNSVLYSDIVLKWKLSRMHGSVVATQMYCDPQANSAFNFLEEWIPPRIDFKDIVLDNWNWYIIVDPAQKVSDDADNTIMWAVGVSGRGDDKTYLWADLIRDKLSLEGKQKALFDMVARFTNNRKRPTVFYERVSMQSDIQHYHYVMNQTGYIFDILEASGKPKLNYGMTASGNNLKYKDLRISALQPSLKQGRHRFVSEAIHTNWKGEKEDMLKTFFEEEYVKYPFGEHDDGLDAMCRSVDLDVGIQMVGIDFNDIRKKKPKPKGIDYFSKDTYQPYRIELTS